MTTLLEIGMMRGTPVAGSLAPKVRNAEIERVAVILRDAKGWQTKREIAALLGVPLTSALERKLRLIAEISAPLIISHPGSPGLCFCEYATDEEIKHAALANRSQAMRQFVRAGAYEKLLAKRARARLQEPEQIELL